MKRQWKWMGAGLLGWLCMACQTPTSSNRSSALAEQILNDTLMNRVEQMAREVVKGGFNAGDGYGEVWIRDYNTFIELAMEEMPDSLIQDNLLTFFRFQGDNGEIVDGFIDASKAKDVEGGYKYRRTPLEPRPMFERVVKNQGFYEWYARDGKPSGSGTFRGEAGVLFRAIQDFRNWAKEQ